MCVDALCSGSAVVSLDLALAAWVKWRSGGELTLNAFYSHY